MISEDAEECSRAIALMAYAIAPKLERKGYLASQICVLSSPESITTRRNLDTKIESSLLSKIFESSIFRRFLVDKCPSVATTVSFHRKSSKSKSEYEISLTLEGKEIRAQDKRPLSEKILEIKNSLLSNRIAFQSDKFKVNIILLGFLNFFIAYEY